MIEAESVATKPTPPLGPMVLLGTIVPGSRVWASAPDIVYVRGIDRDTRVEVMLRSHTTVLICDLPPNVAMDQLISHIVDAKLSV
jgi:hypothetical protein